MTAHAYWYLTRGTGVVALLFVTAAVVIGIIASLRVGGGRSPRFVVAGLHRNISLVTVAFIVVHVVTTVLDAYAPISFVDAVVPFVSAYRPIWLGLGAVAFDIVLALIITSLVRVRLGLRTWRSIHWFAYACFPIAVVHALGTGTDAAQGWMLNLVIACIGIVVTAALVRLWQLRHERLPWAVAGTAAIVVLVIATAAWAHNGPLAPGWAKRAGTPTRLTGAGHPRIARTTSISTATTRTAALSARSAR
jgi:DMSO/TMAO reductase YedYZ heme-binding membrane subunit